MEGTKKEIYLLEENKSRTTRNYLVFRNVENFKFVVCSNWDEITRSWDWGHYFSTLDEARAFLYEEEYNEETETEKEKEKVIEALETGNDLYNVLFYHKYNYINITDIISQYVFTLEKEIKNNEIIEEIHHQVASELKRNLIG